MDKQTLQVGLLEPREGEKEVWDCFGAFGLSRVQEENCHNVYHTVVRKIVKCATTSQKACAKAGK